MEFNIIRVFQVFDDRFVQDFAIPMLEASLFSIPKLRETFLDF